MLRSRYMENYNKLVTDISNWLKDYLEGKGKPPEERTLQSFIIGVSGGVDSALVSTLCAMTGKPTYAISIPIESSLTGTSLALQHCHWLEVRFSNVHVIDIDMTTGYEAMATLLPKHDLANANLKSRIRMSTLYHYATLHRGIVVGTGNKIEDYGVGFFTKYGDGGVDIAPIGDLTKTEVRDCARHLGVIEGILNAPPSDGLWGVNDTTHTDEAQLGASYEELEWAMNYCGSTHIVQVLTPRQEEIKAIYQRLHTRNKHKMAPVPIFRKQ